MNNYWIIKGNPADYDWDKDLRPGYVEPWGTRYAEPSMKKYDRVFLWESGGKSRIIGLAAVERIDGKSRGRWGFRVKYLTSRFDGMIGIAALKAIQALRDATFLKPGIFRTIYPLQAQQAAIVYRTVISSNPADDIWRDLSRVRNLPDVDLEFSVREGRRQLVSHLRIERAPGLAKAKKEQFRKNHAGRLFCECCDKNHIEYGEHHEAIFEVHHLQALGKAKKRVVTKLSDLAVICSNCHRAIHRHTPMISVAQLSKWLKISKQA